ncbi:Microtubules assembly and stabilization protein [Sporothrix curviconia]|uniref:Microtubules assembly and stabilization protein n=1 Tax=Sporothrix curviconia TaxID=1260050 RepID=A0ABP0CFA7_9PEZI
MEHIHGIDVSWMTHGSHKDSNAPKPTSRRRNTLQSHSAPVPLPTTSSPIGTPPAGSPISGSPRATSPPVPIPTANAAANAAAGGHQQLSSSLPASSSGSPRGRRPSWFSNISSKFSANAASSPPQATNAAPKQAELSVPRANPAKNAVLQHAAKYEGEGPYTPAPPKSSGQAGLLHVFRRLSTSGGNTERPVKGNHGLVERCILNIDPNRERCKLQELNQAKLRRVAFSVDVEIAPMPRYLDLESAAKVSGVGPVSADKTQKRKIIEKSEGDALKNAKAVLATEDANHLPKPTAPTTPTASAAPATVSSSPTTSTAPKAAPTSATPAVVPAKKPVAPTPATDATPATSPANSAQPASSARAINGDAKTPADNAPADPNRKKEKKKRSEEERKLRKERKRRQAEANGLIPIEIYADSDDSDNASAAKSTPSTAPTTPRPQIAPTTNPLRIYRRCCQLRETPILKKVTEQLSDLANAAENGVVSKLDLTGYWLHLGDVVTLGDFLAIVPIREVILENCGLNDEGLRVILAGLLAARKPQKKHHLRHIHRHLRGVSSVSKSQTPPATAHSLGGGAESQQGGVVERLVLKNNKIGIEGWKHICLFIHMCHTLKAFDLSNVVFPHVPMNKTLPTQAQQQQQPQGRKPFDVCKLLSKSIAERHAGATLELLNFGDTGLTSEQLGWIVDGIIQSGTKRLGLAHNDLDEAGVQHVARYLISGRCEGLDLGGNDLRNRLEVLADAAATNTALWALSLADCNLTPSGLCKLLPKLTHLPNFRFLDLSHNHELFETRPSATVLLRRYLPAMESLKRLHLSDVAMNSEQAIAIAEVLPEVKELAHLNIQQNPELIKLADARTEETQEQACALYASFLAATRLSQSIVALDMPVPTPESTDIVRAMAKQVLAYCLRNVDRVTLGNPAALVALGNANSVPPTTDLAPDTSSDSTSSKTSLSKGDADYPDVLQHLVGHDAFIVEEDEDIEAAPDDDYVIGGTGVAQALECCLKNRGPEQTDRPTDEFVFDSDSLPAPGKAKDMSKHLLQSARKIRLRLQPALQKARSLSADGDNQAYQRLLFLDNTLDGIIKRFEDEFPETRVSTDSGVSLAQPATEKLGRPHALSLDSGDADADAMGEAEAEAEAEGDNTAVFLSDGEDETDILPSRLSRSNSIMSLSSKGLTNEEGRMLRQGHRFRSGWFKHYNLLSGIDEISSDPAHNHVLYELINEINDANITKKLAEKGLVRLFKEDREEMLQKLKAQDPEHWDRFIESQEKARANLKIELGEGANVGGSALLQVDSNESAILDD